MKKVLLGLPVLAVLLVMLVIPSTVAAEPGLQPFTATAPIVQTSPGIAIPIIEGGKLVGLWQFGEVFEGTFVEDPDDLDWDPIIGAHIEIIHNSKLLFDEDLGGHFTGTAWGTFTMTKDGSIARGTYQAEMDGTLAFPEGYVQVVDTGHWTAWKATGVFEEMVRFGRLTAIVEGVIGDESGDVLIEGWHR